MLPSFAMDLELEIVACTAAEISAAVQGGADRVELCSAIELGGLTPTPGLLDWSAERIPVVAMLRPHADSFVYSADDRAVLRKDLVWLSRSPAKAIVFGALTPEGKVDSELLAEVVASGKPVVFHRAFDAARDRDEALEALVELGAVRVLTSGGAASALEGAMELAATVAKAAGRISILPGGGIRPENLPALLQRIPTSAVHAAPFRGGPPSPLAVSGFRRCLEDNGE